MRFTVLLSALLVGSALAAPVSLPQDIATTDLLTRDAAPEPAGGFGTLLKAVTKFKGKKAPPPAIKPNLPIKGKNMVAPPSPGPGGMNPLPGGLKLNLPIKGKNMLSPPASP